MNKILLRLALIALALLPLGALAVPASGYWWNTVQPGRGFVIEIQGNQMFMAGFLYDVSGRATWVASSGAMTNPTQFSGPLVTYRGGQTLTGNYQSATLQSPPIGTLSINFTSDTAGTLTWPGGTIPIQRFDFGPGGAAAVQAATNPEPGWWWNTSEGGRGFAIEVQGGSLYFAGYMYDASGNPLWYLASGTMANPTTFQGQWTQFGNGQTLTGPFKAASVVNGNVGAATLQFTNAYSATLTLPNSGQIPLTRFAFGVAPPVLTAFSPSATTPEQLLTVSGSGFDPSGVVTLTLFDSTGYSVTIPAAAVTQTAIKVPVPPYIAASGAFGTGPVQVQATQKSNGISLNSNTVSGFTIQPLPSVPGTPGQSTISLIRANLAEAQRLQTSIVGTAQDTPAIAAALAQQVANLQALVTNVQNVVQNGQTFALGVIGGVNVTVTQNNIGDVDSLILATLQSLANPITGSGFATGQASSPTCLSAEASALASAMTSGSGNLDQLAQNLLQASGRSSACNTSAAFTSAYQIFGGAGGVGLGIANGAGGGFVGSRLPGSALFAAAAQNASGAVGINALISPALVDQITSVKSAIANVAAQSNPTTNLLLAKTTGSLATNLSGAQNLTTTSSTASGIQKAKTLVNALNSDAALVTGSNAPPKVLASFDAQLDSIMSTISKIEDGGASPMTVAFNGGIVNVAGVKSGSTTTYTAVVTRTGGGTYTSTWVVTSSTSGTVKTTSAQASGSLMPVSTGAAATAVGGTASMTENTVTGNTLSLTANNVSLSTANNGNGLAESLAINTITGTSTTNADGSFATRHVTGTLSATMGSATYGIAIDISVTGNDPNTSGTINMTYSGPNGTFNFTDQSTNSGNMKTDTWTVSQGTINVAGKFGPYSGSRPSLPSSLAVYDGTTQIGTLSGKTISFVDGSFIAFTF